MLKKSLFILPFLVLLLSVWFVMQGASVPLLNPKGLIALEQRNLMITVIALMLPVAIPLIFSFYFFAYKYRADNGKPRKHEEHPTRGMELVWWIIPAIFIFLLALITWSKTHALDPYKALESDVAPVKIQVIALNWKWLFLYPDQGIATVNFIQFPVDTPINFELTADAPMNAFWIPSLGGQIYAMTGMSTKLHLVADHIGDYRGQAGEINGHGFSGMTFTARASTQEDFDRWVKEAKTSSRRLDSRAYSKLAVPSEDNPVVLYSSYEQDLYNSIVMKFMQSHPTEMPVNDAMHSQH